MRVFMPLYSIEAWGRFYGIYPFGSFYPHAPRNYGYCIYQRRRTPHGTICIKEKYYKPSNEPSPAQLFWKRKYAYGVRAWQALTPDEKEIYNNYRYPSRISGYNRFLHYYLRGKPY